MSLSGSRQVTAGSESRLDVVCMLWRRPGRQDHEQKKRYLAWQVLALRRMLRRTTGGDVRLTCVTNVDGTADVADVVVRLPDEVAALPSQYPKLWLHSGEFAERIGSGPLLYTDLDVVVTGDWRVLLGGGTPRFRGNYASSDTVPAARVSPIARLTGRTRPDPDRRTPPFSTSLFAFEPGQLRGAWEDFSLRRARSIRGWTGTDQKWMNWHLGRSVEMWPPGPQFGLIFDLLERGAAPGPESLLVTCTHRLTPWDPAVRERLPWLEEAYPLD